MTERRALKTVSRTVADPAPAQTAERANRFLRSLVGPLVVFAAAAVVAITFSLAPASDGPAPIAGPLSGHSILHFPR